VGEGVSRILIVYDVHAESAHGRIGWALWRRAEALKKYAPQWCEVDTCSVREIKYPTLRRYDLLFHLDYASVQPRQFREATTRTTLVVSFNSDAGRRREMFHPLHRQCDYMILNNREAWETFGRLERTACIPNGVDSASFTPTTPIAEREHRVFWTGSGNPAKGKGYEIMLAAQPELEREGFICDFRPVNNIVPEEVLTTEKLAAVYDSSSYVACMSKSDATPNVVLEAGLMGCVPVSCPVGNINEFGRDCENCVLVDRSVEGLISGLKRARDNREALSAGIRETMLGWTYGEPGYRARVYFDLFESLLRGSTPAPFYGVAA
jgi:glycosyltransferase involved in cell wall biosynthesis